MDLRLVTLQASMLSGPGFTGNLPSRRRTIAAALPLPAPADLFAAVTLTTPHPAWIFAPLACFWPPPGQLLHLACLV